MAQFKTDFSEYPVGVLPSDWTPIWVTTNSTWTIASKTDASLGQNVLEHTATADARRAITWDTVGSFTGDFDILAKWRTSDSASGNIPIRIFAFVSGTSTQSSQQGYQLDGLFPSTIRIGRTSNGSYSTLASNTGITTMQPNTWYWYRFRKVGSLLEARIWADGGTEPSTWDVSISNTLFNTGPVGLGAFDFNGVRDIDYFAVGTNGDVAPPPTEAPPPDTTAPAEITNLTEQHTDLAIDFNWTNPTDADFASVNVYRDGSFFAGNIANGRFTDSSVQPNTTYVYRFTTEDTIGNESAGVEWTVTTDQQRTYEQLRPVEIISINNLTPNDVTYIQDDPDAEDANVMVPIDNLSRPTVRLRFQQPNMPIAGIQTIRWVVDDPNYVGSLVRIYEGGVLILESPLQYPIGGTEPVVFVFDADDYITDKTLQTVEVEFVSTLYNGLTVQNFGAIVWRNPVDESLVSLDGSIQASTTVSASLRKTIPVNGSIVSASSMSGSATAIRGIEGQGNAASSLTGELGNRRSLEGTGESLSTVTAELTKTVSMTGSTASGATISGEAIVTRGLQGEVQAQAGGSSTLSVTVPITGSTAAGSTLTASMARSYDLQGSVTAQSTVNGNLREVDSFVGSISSGATAAATLSIDKGMEGSVDSASGISGTAGILRSMEGTGTAAATMEGNLNRQLYLSGTIGATSDTHADDLAIQGQVRLAGSIPSLSSTSGTVSVAKPLSGHSDAVTGTGGTLSADRPLEGTIGTTSEVAATLAAGRPLEGTIAAGSTLSADMAGAKPLEGTIDGRSNLTADITQEGQIDFRGTIAAGSTLSATMAASKPLTGSITSLSSMSGTVVEGTQLTGGIQAASGVSATLSGYKPISGQINANTSLTGDVTTEGAIPLSGSIAATTNLSGVLDQKGQATLIGTVTVTSGAGASIRAFKPFDGTINVNSDVYGDATNTVPLDAHIFVSSSLSGEIEITADITLNGSIGAASGVSSELLINRSLIGQTGSETEAAAMLGKRVQITGTIRSISTGSGTAGKVVPIRGDILASSILYDQEPINTLVEINDVLYSGVASEDDGKALTYTIDSGVGRRIEFVFEFTIDPINLMQLQFRVEGTLGQPFQLQAYDPASETWDTTTAVAYGGTIAEQFVTLTLETPSKFLNSSNQIRLRMLSLNTFASGTMTLSTDYAELIKTYQVKAG